MENIISELFDNIYKIDFDFLNDKLLFLLIFVIAHLLVLLNQF